MSIETAIVAPVRAYREALVGRLGQSPGIAVVYHASIGPSAVAQLVRRRPPVALVDFTAEHVVDFVAEARALAPFTRLVAYGVGESSTHSQAVVRAAACGVSAFVECDRPVEEIISAVHRSALDQPVCSPRVVSLLLQALQRGSRSAILADTGWARTADGLTPKERLVADLAARGMTNRQIAARLCVGESTVKTHMHAILRKLGLASRTELAAGITGESENAEKPPPV